MNLLVLQHDADAPAGLLAEWAAARGAALEVVRLDRGELVTDGIAAFDRVVTLGSGRAADDDTVPWQPVEQAALRAATEAGVPVLGICFGGQSLARALGGGVRRAARPEIGWGSIGALDGGLDDGPWMQWHEDEILPPEDAVILARNASGVQAFRLGPQSACSSTRRSTSRSRGLAGHRQAGRRRSAPPARGDRGAAGRLGSRARVRALRHAARQRLTPCFPGALAGASTVLATASGSSRNFRPERGVGGAARQGRRPEGIPLGFRAVEDAAWR